MKEMTIYLYLESKLLLKENALMYIVFCWRRKQSNLWILELSTSVAAPNSISVDSRLEEE